MTLAGILILDLDGTVLVGDQPVLRYAELAAQGLDDGTAAGVRGLVDGYLAGSPEPPVEHAVDGYAATAAAAIRAGVGADALQSAFERSRGELHAGLLPVDAPPGLADLLHAAAGRVLRVLATNAPAEDLDPVLHRVGLGGLFDRVHGRVGKPAGQSRLAAGLLDEHGWRDEPARMMSVGDIWANDLEPVAALGGRTALIDRWSRGDGAPGERGRTWPELIPAVHAWLAGLDAV